MKILQVNNYFFPKTAVDEYYLDLCNQLEQDGHQVSHFSVQHQTNQKSNYTSYFLSEKENRSLMGQIYSLEAAEMIKRLVKEVRPDVAHVHNITGILTPAVLVSLSHMKVPVVKTMHDFDLFCPNGKMFTKGEPCERCKSLKYWNAVLYKCKNNSTSQSLAMVSEKFFNQGVINPYRFGVKKFIAPSKFCQAKAIDWGVRKQSILHIPYALQNNIEQKSAKLDQVVFVGELEQENGVEVLLKAMQQLKRIKVVIIGSGSKEKKIRDIARDLGVDYQIIASKFIEQRDKIIAESKALILPTLGYRADLLTAVRALSLSTPVICSRIGGFEEVIEHEKNGYLFEAGNSSDLNNCLTRILDDASLQVSVSEDPWREHIRALMQLYENVQK